jgi:uncharacterized phage protein (TIGR02218 family)
VATYDDDEESVRAGDVVEMFEFVGPGGLAWRYTSNDQQQVYNGNVFTPLAITCGELPADGISDAEALIIGLPAASPVPLAYALGNAFRRITLNVYRKQVRSGEVERVWSSSIAGSSIRGRMAELRSPSPLSDRLATEAPVFSFQQQCGNVLFDEHCRVLRTSFVFNALVSGANGDTLTLNTVGIHPDGWFNGGEIIRNVDEEPVLILRQVGAVLTLAYPFRTIANGDAVTLYAGCDHLVSTCFTKFNDNVDNFIGAPLIPKADVFKVNVNSIGG